MPKKKGVKNKNKPEKVLCVDCNKEKRISDFYSSSNLFMHPSGKIPYCKNCLRKRISDEEGNVDFEKLKMTLQMIDRPFLYNVWKTSMEDKGDTFGVYMKNVQLHQYRNLGWSNSKFLPETEEKELNYDDVEDNVDFKITNEMVNRWGRQTESDYRKLEQFYWDMKDRNKIETPQEEAYLKKLAIISMKMDAELEQGHYDEVKKLGDLFSKYMGDSQFRTIDKSGADKHGGLRSFGKIYEEVEKDDFIPPWEYYRKLKGVNQDIVDKTIMYILNFTLRLNKAETMIQPPEDTPKLESYEVDDDIAVL